MALRQLSPMTAFICPIEQLLERIDLAGHGSGREVFDALEGHVDHQLAFARERVVHGKRYARLHRFWFEAHEPSSPVALLLRQAERLTGKRFDEVFQAIPAELVERWMREH